MEMIWKMSEKSENRVCITKEINGTKIEVWFSDEGDIRDSVILLEKISRRLPVEQTRYYADALWETISGNLRINGRVVDKGQRIALSLLHAYPSPKNNSEIMEECSLSKDEAYDNLSGRRGSMGDWFMRIEEGSWTLTNFGEKHIHELVSRLLKEND